MIFEQIHNNPKIMMLFFQTCGVTNWNSAKNISTV